MLKVPEKSIKKKRKTEKYIAQSIKSFSRLHQKEKLKDGLYLEKGEEEWRGCLGSEMPWLNKIINEFMP